MRRLWTVAIVVAILAFIVAADREKAKFLGSMSAQRFGAKNPRVQSVTFDGLWRVTFETDQAGSGKTVRYSVTPILPITMR